MRRARLLALMALAVIHGAAAQPTIVLSGKTQSRISAKVVKMFVFEVTDNKGGWFGEALEMKQLGGWDSPYSVSARLRVTSTEPRFQVRLDAPVEIRNQANPAQLFQRPQVVFGGDDGNMKEIVVGRSTLFTNPPPAVPSDDSIGYYTLAISAHPPTGNFREVAGTYGGTVSITFEPVISMPE